MPPREMLAAVVLAGGQSRRMGRDKATMPHPDNPGLTMVEHTVAVLAQRCDPVFVIAARGQVLPALNAEILIDHVPGLGPLPATGRGLRAAAVAGCHRAFVAAVDMPNLGVDLVDRLAGYRGVDVVLPWDGRDHYLAGIYRTALVERVDALVDAGERSMRALSDSVVTVRVMLAPGPALANLNEPGDRGER